MHYYFLGDLNAQKTVVFLHGWGTDSSIFRWVLSFLPVNGIRYLLIDFWGFGKSIEKEKPLTIYDYAEDVKVLLEELKINNPIIIGHSFGGRVGIVLAHKHNGFISKLVLVDSAGIKPRRGIKYYLSVYRYKFCKFLVKSNLMKKDRLLKFGSDEYKVLSKTMKQTYINVVNEDLTYCLRDIKCDTLIIWGKNDKDTPLYMAKKIKKHVKKSNLVIIEDAGHFCFLDKMQEFVYILYTKVL